MDARARYFEQVLKYLIMDNVRRANELAVKEGIPFRDAYQRVAAEIAGKRGR